MKWESDQRLQSAFGENEECLSYQDRSWENGITLHWHNLKQTLSLQRKYEKFR